MFNFSLCVVKRFSSRSLTRFFSLFIFPSFSFHSVTFSYVSISFSLLFDWFFFCVRFLDVLLYGFLFSWYACLHPHPQYDKEKSVKCIHSMVKPIIYSHLHGRSINYTCFFMVFLLFLPFSALLCSFLSPSLPY